MPEPRVYFMLNGTGANVAALSCLVKPWEAVLAPSTAHLQTDECGAFERFTGSKVVPIATPDGKLRPADLEPYLRAERDEHFPQPRVVTVSQTTEYGDLYEPDELRELCRFAHEHGLLVHVDGARIANAAAALSSTPRAITKDVGVDVLSFGGTKNGLMLGEAACFFNPELGAEAMPFARKQAMQLPSKMRYIAAQFEALLSGDRWLKYASHANKMAQRLLAGVRNIAGHRSNAPRARERNLREDGTRRNRTRAGAVLLLHLRPVGSRSALDDALGDDRSGRRCIRRSASRRDRITRTHLCRPRVLFRIVSWRLLALPRLENPLTHRAAQRASVTREPSSLRSACSRA